MPVRVLISATTVVGAAGILLAVMSWQGVTWSALAVLMVFHWLFMNMTPRRLLGSQSGSSSRQPSIALSASFAIVLAAIILLPPAAAGVVAATGTLNRLALRRSHRWLKLAFNTGQMWLSGAAGGVVYDVLGGDHTLHGRDFPYVLLPIAAATCAAYVVNTGLVSLGVAWMGSAPLVRTARMVFIGNATGYFGYGSIGLLMAVLWSGRYGAIAVGLAPLPLVVAAWAFSQYAAEQRAYERTIKALIQAVEIKDYYTRGHSERVARASEMIGRALNMPENRIASLRFAGMLHDIGKLGVPTKLLRKPGRLTADEYATIKMHPLHGVDIVRDIDFLGEAYVGIMHHHERLDGCGYPTGLAGDRIPEFARAIAVADAFDCMTSTRSYRCARSVEAALSELWRCAGTQFDPTMVRALATALESAERAGRGWRPVNMPSEPAAAGSVATLDHDEPRFADDVAGDADDDRPDDLDARSGAPGMGSGT